MFTLLTRSARAKRHAFLLSEIWRVHRAPFIIYSPRKLRLESFDGARCAVARLMLANVIEGMVRKNTPVSARSPRSSTGNRLLLPLRRQRSILVSFCMRDPHNECVTPNNDRD